jgi:hypothetical protein
LPGTGKCSYRVPVASCQGIQNTGYRLQVTGFREGQYSCRVPVARYREMQLPGTGCQLPGNTKYSYRLQVTGFREIQNTVRFHVAGFREYKIPLQVPCYREGQYSCRIPVARYREMQLPVTGYQLPGNTKYSYRFHVTGFARRSFSVGGLPLMPCSSVLGFRFHVTGSREGQYRCREIQIQVTSFQAPGHTDNSYRLTELPGKRQLGG